MNHPGSQGGRYSDDGFGRDGDFISPSERAPAWQPGWDLGQQAGRQVAGYGGQGYPSTDYNGAGYNGAYDHRAYDTGTYGADGYGHERDGGYAGEPADGYGQNGYSQGGYGHQDYGSGPESYGRDMYAQEGYGSQDQYGPRPDTGSFARDDSGWFGRPDTGSFGRPDEYSRSDQQYGDRQYGAQADYEQYPGVQYPADPYSPKQYPADQYPGNRYPADDSDDSDESEDVGDWDDPGQPRAAWEDDRDGGLLSRRFGDDDDNGNRGRRGRRAGRAKRQRRTRAKVAFTASIAAVAVVIAAAGVYGYQRYQTWHTSRYGDYQGAGTGKADITVTPGTSLAELGPALVRQGVIMEIRPFDTAAGAAHNADDLQPGVYQLRHHMSSALAVSWLLSTAHRIKDQVTIIEGMRASKIASVLSAQTKIPVSQFTEIIKHPPASLGLPSWAPKNASAEGFLFPDTYTLLPHMSALQVLQAMVREFNDKVASINMAGEAKKVFITPWQALIVASLIQDEAGNVSDFRKISRVAWNRYAKNMPLQFDSTVFYALNTYGTAATAQQQKVNSPYNTYAHTGLPPGPISSPGVLAMQAAVHPVKGDLLYFITDTRKKPYKTYFTASFAQFEQWKQEFEG
ncbi:MAG TPA: endolytic transglycosylase MltG [Streptosporangiaceae bacterium]|nr:endolytic transglycosylase MltG [Streptosporangiaceae bacterium]